MSARPVAVLKFGGTSLATPQVRDLAHEMGLIVADKHDSQDICFVPTGRYTDIIGRLRPNAVEPGDIVDLQGRVITIQTADTNPSKPDPAMLRHAAAECGLAPCDIVMVGDTAYDMTMASAARTGAVGVSWGYHSLDELNKAGAQVVLDTFDNITEVLDTLTGVRG